MKVRNQQLVDFISPRMLVRIRWDPRSGEIDTEISSRAGPHEPAFRIADVLRIAGVSIQALAGAFQASDEARITAVVRRLADLLREYGGNILEGDPFALRRLANDRAESAVIETQESRYRSLRSRAESAWNRKDFRAVNDSYSQMEEVLTQVERTRLEYARSRLRPAGPG